MGTTRRQMTFTMSNGRWVSLDLKDDGHSVPEPGDFLLDTEAGKKYRLGKRRRKILVCNLEHNRTAHMYPADLKKLSELQQ